MAYRSSLLILLCLVTGLSWTAPLYAAEGDHKATDQQEKEIEELRQLIAGEKGGDEVYFVALMIQQFYLKWPAGPEYFDPVVEVSKKYPPIGPGGSAVSLNLNSKTMYAEWYVQTKLDALALKKHIKSRPNLSELQSAIDICLKRLDAVEQYLLEMDLISGDKVKEKWAAATLPYAEGAAQAFGEAFVRRMMSVSSTPDSKEALVLKLIFELGVATYDAVNAAQKAGEKYERRARNAAENLVRADQPLDQEAKRIWKQLGEKHNWPFVLKTHSNDLKERQRLYEGEQSTNPVLGLAVQANLPELCKDEKDVLRNIQKITSYLRAIPAGAAYMCFREPFVVTYFELQGLRLDHLLSHSVPGAGSYPSHTEKYAAEAKAVVTAAKVAIPILEKRKEPDYALQVRSQLAYAYAALRQSESALTEYMNVAKLRLKAYPQDWDSQREFREAKLAAAGGLYQPALDLLQQQVERHREDILHNPDFANLRQKHPQEFHQLTDIAVNWNFEIGVLSDTITITNRSKFSLSDITLTVELFEANNFNRERPDYLLVLKGDNLYAGQSRFWNLDGKQRISNRNVTHGRIKLQSKQGAVEQVGSKG